MPNWCMNNASITGPEDEYDNWKEYQEDEELD